MSTRLNVNLNDETAKALRDIAEVNGQTVTEAVRRVVSVYHFFNQARRQGKEIRVIDEATGRLTIVEII